MQTDLTRERRPDLLLRMYDLRRIEPREQERAIIFILINIKYKKS
jgi:hypothetical protein